MSEPGTTAPVTGASRRIARVTTTSGWLCLAGAALGGLGLFGWVTGADGLTRLVPGQPPLMPNTAVSLTLIGVVGAVLGRGRPRRVVRIACRVAGLVVLAVGLGTLAEYALGIDLRIDELLLPGGLAPGALGPYPGRPTPPTAMTLALVGAAILLFDSRPTARTRPSEWLLILAGLGGLVGVTGQLLGMGPIYHLPRGPMVGMAVPTAVSVLLSSAGLLLGWPSAGILAVATSDGPGGMLLRRIAAPTVVVPMLLAFAIARLVSVLAVGDLPLVVLSVATVVTAGGLAALVVTAHVLDRTHDELEASRARTREVIALASDGIFMADADARFVEVNEAGCRLLGLTEAEIVGQAVRDFLPPDEGDRLAREWAELLDGSVRIGEWHLRHRSGRYIPVEVSTRFLPGGRWQAFVRDSSERKAAEEEARRSKARIEGIISIAADAIISIDASGRITMFNHEAERSFGWTAREALGQPLDILLPERFRKAHRADIRAFANAVETSRRVGERAAPIHGLRKDGTEFVAEGAISRLRIGDELTFTVVLRDVTRERRRSAQEQLLAEIGLLLTSSLDRKRLVRQAAELLVREFADACLIDLVEDPETGLVVSRSAVVHRDPGMSATALAFERVEVDRRRPHLGSASLETRQAVLVPRVTPEYLDSIAQPGEHGRLLRELAPVSLITIPLQARGLLLGLLTFVSSDPKRRYDEGDLAFVEEIAQRLALATDNARLFETATNAITARDEMLRIVAHDLRNPLGAIVLRASLLREDTGGDQRRESAVAIATAAQRMNRLIADLLDVTKSEAGHLSVHAAPVPARAVVCEAVAAQRGLAAKAGLELRTDVSGDLPDVRGDHDRLLQIFENLIGNAVKFTPRGGSVVVGATRRGRAVSFWVKDTGEGIPAEDLPHVFDRFWQARKRRSDGAGLGLAIVKALVEAHGGRSWVESAPGGGSTFCFTIPASIAPVRAAGEPDAVPPAIR